MHKLQLGKHVSSWSPAGVAQQSQDKQVPVLRLLSVSEPFESELRTPFPLCTVHRKYKMCVKRKQVLFYLSCLHLIPDLSKSINSDLIELSKVT